MLQLYITLYIYSSLVFNILSFYSIGIMLSLVLIFWFKLIYLTVLTIIKQFLLAYELHREIIFFFEYCYFFIGNLSFCLFFFNNVLFFYSNSYNTLKTKKLYLCLLLLLL
jgi:hypothetical protein